MAPSKPLRSLLFALVLIVASVYASSASSDATRPSSRSSVSESESQAASPPDPSSSALLSPTRGQSSSSDISYGSISVTAASATASSASSISSSSLISSAASATSASSTSTSASPSQTAIPTDVATMISRRVDFIVAGASDATSNITSWIATLGPDGKWPDSEVDYTTGCPARRANWPAQTHWQRLLRMAAAWNGGVPGGEQFVKDPSLLSAISNGMDFWFENDYQDQACLDKGGNAACPCGTPGLWNTNWFSNVILIPNLVAQTCLLVRTNLSDTQHGNCTHIPGRTYGTFDHVVGGLGIATGANLLDIARIGIDEGLLNANISQLTDAYRRIHGEAIVQNAIKADGIRADGSFGQHGGVLYNGNYGKDYANDVLLLEIIAGGTQFAAGQTNKDAFASLIDADQWMIFRNTLTNVLHWDFSALGRFISFPVIDSQATGSININITEIQQLGELWDSSTLTTVHDRLSSPSKDANVGGISGNRMFFANDYMVQRGPGYITTVKMYSPRTKNTECLNDQNPLGFHLSDGTVYTYLKGNEYEDIEAAWDWNLIPGTTVDYHATPLSCGTAEHTGLNAFVGGVSTGQTGIAAMSFTNPTTRSLSWKKAWFFLPDDVQVVLLPTLTSNGTAPVFSVLDQKRHNGPVLVDGAPVTPQHTNFSRPRSLWHDGVGYLLDGTVPLSVDVQNKTGNWSALGISAQGLETVDLFAAWLYHGVGGAARAPVAYTVFPAVSQKAFMKKAGNTRVQTVRNDAGVSAVYDAVHRTAMFVFWNSAGGSAEFSPSPFEASITVNSTANAAVIYQVDSGNVTVSDPSQSLHSVDLTFTSNDFGKRPQNWGSDVSKQLHFDLPSGGLAGASVTHTV